MAHFYGTVRGQAINGVSRIGSKKSGLETTAASWQGSVEVILYERDGEDWTRVYLRPWHGHGSNKQLYNGPIGGPTKK